MIFLRSEGRHSKIKKIVTGLSPDKKKALKPQLDKLGLPTKYSNLNTVEELRQYLSLIE